MKREPQRRKDTLRSFKAGLRAYEEEKGTKLPAWNKEKRAKTPGTDSRTKGPKD